MTKTRIILFLAAAGIIAAIYHLPRIVIESKDQEEIAISEKLQQDDPHMGDPTSIPDSAWQHLNQLKDSFANSDSKEKRLIFADSLAGAYQKLFFFDSAAFLMARVAGDYTDDEGVLEKAGDAFFEAFNFAVSKERQNELGEQARSYYQRVLTANPGNLNAKANMALTYVSSSSPMQGIAMLREILEENPVHEKTLYNLGLLSITSGQLDKAIERFEMVKENYPGNYSARLYLGYCYLETAQEEKAKEEFESLLSSGADEALKSTARQYLESIK